MSRMPRGALRHVTRWPKLRTRPRNAMEDLLHRELRGQCGLARPRELAGGNPAWVIVRREPSIEPCRVKLNKTGNPPALPG